MQSTLASPVSQLLERVDFLRLDAARKLEPTRKSQMGQFLTPAPVARLMASMFEVRRPTYRLLDAGAGVGSLLAAWVAEMCQRAQRPKQVTITAYELDPGLIEYLRETLALCSSACESSGIVFKAEVVEDDFIRAAVGALSDSLFDQAGYDCAILNPPYHKLNTQSRTYHLLEKAGVETTNLYTAFLALVTRLLDPGGELVAITPRSFCNGTYFRPFRAMFLGEMAFRRFHLFDTRDQAFRDDEVLQENVILNAVKSREQTDVVISSSDGSDEECVFRNVRPDQVVHPSDPNSFIHLVPDALGDQVVERMNLLTSSLEDLGLAVSTGPVVDFRLSEFLRPEQGEHTVPLIYPGHFSNGFVEWPKPGKKPNALVVSPETEGWLVPSAAYALVKRFSAKEERRRVVAAVYDPERIRAPRVALENHLNFYHAKGAGLSMELAKGLAAFLNSTLVDLYFRHFSGHTQVNAGDLRSLRYPTRIALGRLGRMIGDDFPKQDEVDRLVEEVLGMDGASGSNPVGAQAKIREALEVLRALGFPRQQLNERSALTLLALLNLKPAMSWADADDPLRGITPMMDFMQQHYGKGYAPNTRETVRRQTVHQFLDAGIILANPDDPGRAVNSPDFVYQIEQGTLDLLRTFGTDQWKPSLETYQATVESLKQRYAQEREMQRIPLEVEPGRTITLSPGGQNILIEQIVKEFAPRFTPGAKVLYVGDTDEKFRYFDETGFKNLGITVNEHGKMPDVVIFDKAKDRLMLIEAVTSHGPINPKRRIELQKLFGGAKAELILVTAFLSRKAMVKYLGEMSWETEVWVADSPGHIIHFDGERFLGHDSH